MCVCRVSWSEVSPAQGSHQTLAEYSQSRGRGASLSVLEVPVHLSGLSTGNDTSSDLATGQKLAVILHLLGLSYGATSSGLVKITFALLEIVSLTLASRQEVIF